MSKKFLFKFLIALVFVASAVVWLLSVLYPSTFGNLNLSWIIASVCAVLGLIFIGRGLFSKKLGIAKKLNILIGAGFIVAGVFALVGTIVKDSLVWPIIAVVIAVALLLCLFATGGKKWDEADNQKVGYKDYYARKAEEEKEEYKDN